MLYRFVCYLFNAVTSLLCAGERTDHNLHDRTTSDVLLANGKCGYITDAVITALAQLFVRQKHLCSAIKVSYSFQQNHDCIFDNAILIRVCNRDPYLYNICHLA